MENYIQTGLGIFVSLILFLIGYRQTVGVKKERISNANSEVEKILIRRIVIEKYTPDIIDISRLIDGKARDFKINSGDMLYEDEIANSIYTRIIENDYLTTDHRNEIIDRLSPLLKETDKYLFDESENDIPKNNIKKESLINPIQITTLLAIIASVLGSFLSMYLYNKSFHPLDAASYKILGITAITSIILISIISFLKTFKDSSVSVDDSNLEKYEETLNFKNDVIKYLNEIDGSLMLNKTPEKWLDYSINYKNKNIALIIKYSSSRNSFNNKFKNITKYYKFLNNYDECIIVFNRFFIKDYRNIVLFGKIKFMTLDDFKKYLK